MNPFFKELAAQYGTPLYAYDLAVADTRARELLSLLPETAGTRLLYSFKSNPLPSLAEALRKTGCEADLTSPGEIRAAQTAGFDFARALYGGPGKGEAEIDIALESGIRQFSVESWHDLETIAAAARHRGVQVRGLIRVNPKEPPRAKLAMAGVASQFGFEEEDLLASGVSRIAAVRDAVSIAGTHIYWGTQIGDPDAILACFSSGIETAERIAAALNFDLEVCNLGGGFPWPYAHLGSGPDLRPLREGLARLRDQSGAARDPAWWFESGRHLSASSGTLIARVMDVKSSKNDKTYLILDTGIHHLGGMSGLGRIPRFSIDVLPLVERGGERKVDLVGQLCTPLDCIARNLTVPNLEPGDLVAIPNTGAYGLTGSVTAFLSRPAPLEIAYRGSDVLSFHQLNTGHRLIAAPAPQLEPASLP